MYDHFHCIYEHDDKQQELEGGFTTYPRGWDEKPTQEKQAWWRQQCIAWGMPETARVVKIWLAR